MTPSAHPALYRIAALVALTIIVVCGVVYVARHQSAGQSSVPQNATATTTYTYAAGGFSIDVPAGWHAAATSELMPPPILKPIFGFVKDGTQCAFVFATTSPYSKEYVQTYFAERANNTNENDQATYRPEYAYNPDWYAPKASLPPDFEFAWHGANPQPGEVMIASVDTLTPGMQRGSLALYDRDGSIVPDDCQADIFTVMHSVTRSVASTTITSDSHGDVVFTGKNIEFVPDADHIPKNGASLQVESGGEPLFYGGKVYYGSADGFHVVTFAPYSDTRITQIPLTTGITINAFYFYANTLYYLAGPDCTSYKARCDLDLYSYVLGSPQPTHLASGVAAREITNYDPATNVLNLAYFDGDAGCSWGATYRYTFATGTYEKVADIGSCEGDPNQDEEFAKEDAVWNSVKYADYLRLDAGVLSIPTGTSTPYSPFNLQIRYEN